MDGKRLIRRLKLKNFLSFGPEGTEIELEPLNVLIGPNGSGKSNFIEAFSILRAAPGRLSDPIAGRGGGVPGWIWKGQGRATSAQLESVVDFPEGVGPLTHRLEFAADNGRLAIVDEVVENAAADAGPAGESLWFYDYAEGKQRLCQRRDPDAQPGSRSNPKHAAVVERYRSTERSALSYGLSEEANPEVRYLGRAFEQIRIYRDWHFGRYAAMREAQDPAIVGDFLLDRQQGEIAPLANLPLMLNRLEQRPEDWDRFTDEMRKFNRNIDKVQLRFVGGRIQVVVREKDIGLISAERISDGTLQYICLLCILLDRTPPPLVCIEEPEIGLHPDALAALGELLIEASQRTQLIVTTHSDALVSALSSVPECVLVCERRLGGTQLRRLDPEKLKTWLEDYALGDVWRMGELGGNPQ